MLEVVELAEQSRKAAGTDVSLASDAELLAAAVVLEAKRASDDAARGHVLAELEVRGVCDREFGLATASWVAHETHGPRAAITGQVKTAVKLRRFPTVDDALSDGTISPDHARVIAAAANPRIEADLVDLQDDLVALAGRCPFPAWRRHVTVLAELLDQNGGYDPAREVARNHLHVSPNGSDGITITGELVGEHALRFTQLVDIESDRLWRAHRHDHEADADLEMPSRATLRALALVELLAKGAAGSAPTGNGPIVDITLVMDADQSDRAISPDGTVVSMDVLRHLCCDATFTPVGVDGDGNPLDVGRQTRFATPAQRRALAVRDGGCVFPGCDLPAGWCDAHHVLPWETGGSTDIGNLALLCRHHHGVTHRTGWAMTALVDQTFTWTSPTGRALTSQRNRGSPSP
jgi:hypothetical protein